MKKIIILVATAAMVMQSSVLFAVDNSQSGKQGQNKSMQRCAGKSDMDMMKQNMQKMVKQMDEIHTTQDLRKRETLMHEHMLNMHKEMRMMRCMGGDMMTGMMDKDMGENMSSKEKGQRHQMMEQRMDMMQMMMEQMMGRMSMQEGMMPNMKK